MSDHHAREVWEATLGDLQIRVTRPSYETWLKGTVGLSLNDGELIVGTPNTFVAEMLEQRMYSLISQAVEKVVRDRVEIRFQVLRPGINNGGVNVNRDLAEDSYPGTASNSSPSPQKQTRVKINAKYTFESFVVGSSNALAHAAAAAVAEQPGRAYNPLFIHAGVGLGKTHLLQAIGHRVHQMGRSLIYTNSEQFTNEYIKAIRERTTDDFREKYRTIDVLLLDDIQFIMGKEQTQEGFFHTFNTLHMDNSQIVITSDRPVRFLSLLADRIRSRLEGGLVVDISPPDLETRLAILEAKARTQRVEISPVAQEVMGFIAELSPRNIRELEGNLNRVIAFSQLTNSPITMELALRALADILSQRDRPCISKQAVIDTVAAHFSTEPQVLIGRKRDKRTALARHVAMYLLRQELDMHLAEIGRIMGSRDHTSVVHACNRISSLLNSDAIFRKDVLAIRNLLLDQAARS